MRPSEALSAKLGAARPIVGNSFLLNLHYHTACYTLAAYSVPNLQFFKNR